MILNFSGSNTCIHNNFDLDFSVTSRQKGKFIKDNDIVTINNKTKILKKIGLIGCNSSGKTSILYKFFLYYDLQDFKDLWMKLMQDSLQDFISIFFREIMQKEVTNSLENINSHIGMLEKHNEMLEKHNKILMKYQGLRIVNYRLKGLENLDENEQEQLISIMNKKFEKLFALNSYDSNKDKIEFRLTFVSKNKIYHSCYRLYNDGHLEISFFNDKNNEEYFKKINLITLQLDENDTTPFVFKDWRLEIISPNFNELFNFSFRLNAEIKNNSKIFFKLFDYINNENKKNNFMKWMKIADSTLDDMVYTTNKSFYFKTNYNRSIDFNLLSLGTKKWLFLYYELIIRPINLSKNFSKIFLFDEIENSFHHKLIDVFFTVIDNQEMLQLLFTTHNPFIFDEFFRQDGIYLTTSNKGKFEIIKLSSLKLRKDIEIDNHYLKEKIGQHPNAQDILDFLDEYEK